MKFFNSILLILVLCSCGIKGKPLPPLKEQEISERSSQSTLETTTGVSQTLTSPKKTQKK